MKYTLLDPIEFGENTVTELNIREKIVSGDMRGIPISGMSHEHVLKLAGRLCGQTEAVMLKLSYADYEQVCELIAGFMGAGPKTGSEDSLQ